MVEKPIIKSNTDQTAQGSIQDFVEKSSETTNSDIRKLNEAASLRSVYTIKESALEDTSTILALDEVIPNTRSDLMMGVEDKVYLRNAIVPFELLIEAKDR